MTTSLNCPNCATPLQAREHQTVALCVYCGSSIKIDAEAREAIDNLATQLTRRTMARQPITNLGIGILAAFTAIGLGAILVIGYDKLFIPRLAAWVAQLQPSGTRIGSVPDVRGTSFFNYGLALYLTVLWRGRRKEK